MLPISFDPSSDEEYTVIPVIPAIPVDSIIHTSERPFCDDPSCYCHEDPGLLAPITQAYQDGLLSAQDATDIVTGRKL